MMSPLLIMLFFFNDTATTEIYTLSLHDALPISAYFFESCVPRLPARQPRGTRLRHQCLASCKEKNTHRSEEHTSELQSPDHLVCRLLLEKKKKRPHCGGDP